MYQGGADRGLGLQGFHLGVKIPPDQQKHNPTISGQHDMVWIRGKELMPDKFYGKFYLSKFEQEVEKESSLFCFFWFT